MSILSLCNSDISPDPEQLSFIPFDLALEAFLASLFKRKTYYSQGN